MLDWLNKKKYRLVRIVLILIVTSLLTGMASATISKNIDVNVIETRDIDLFFINVNANNFSFAVSRNINFLNDTYPISDSGLHYEVDTFGLEVPESLSDNWVKRWWQLTGIRRDILSRMFLSQRKFTNAIGIVKEGYLLPEDGSTGYKFGGIGESEVILVDESQLKTTAHEVGHTFGLCDEYDPDGWQDQNSDIKGGCPNGDLNGDGNLDINCSFNRRGCPTQTFLELYKNYGAVSDNLRNFMGDSDTPDFSTTPPSNFESWVSSNSFNALLDRFDVSSEFSTPLFKFVDFPLKYIVIRVLYEKGGTADILDAHILENGFVHNKSEYSGNFTLEVLDRSGEVISDINFEPEFAFYSENGRRIETNSTFIIFSLPLGDEIPSKIVFKEAATKLAEVIRTPNAPSVNIISPDGGEVFTSDFSISWSASDADNDRLSYAVLLSNDNGAIWNTLTVDHDKTSFLVNVSYLEEGDKYLVKVLATDGINTGMDVSDSVFTVKHVVFPRDLKLDSILKLESVKTDCEYRWWQWWKWLFNKKCKQNKIIDHVSGRIDSSLKPYLWVDDVHLSDKHGEKVFMNEYNAVKYMMAKKKQVSEEAKTVFEEVTTSLVNADKLIAQTIIDDAKNTPVVDPKNQEKVNRGIMDAEDEFGKAEQSVAQEKFDKAILHYKKAWEYAQLAIKFAKKEKEKCWFWWKCKEERKGEKEEKIGVIDAWGKFLDKVGGGYRGR